MSPIGARRPLRIVLDGRYVHDAFPGIGRYTFGLARALGELETHDEILLLVHQGLVNTRHDLEALRGLRGLKLVECRVARFFPAEQVLLPIQVARLRADVFHAPFYLMPWLVPARVVVHVYDLVPLRQPVPPGGPRLHRLAMRLTMARARRVLTLTRAQAEEIGREFPGRAGRVRVVPPGPSPGFAGVTPEAVAEVRARLGLPARYVLSVGNELPHKNRTALRSAWQVLSPALRGQIALVLAGDSREPGPAPDGIRNLGAVAEADLPALHTGAEAIVVPSLEEGFSLPALEALASGAPLACADIPVLREVAGDAALFFDPRNVVAMATALERLSGDAALRSELSRRGPERAKHFSWSQAAQATLEAYREAAGA